MSDYLDFGPTFEYEWAKIRIILVQILNYEWVIFQWEGLP